MELHSILLMLASALQPPAGDNMMNFRQCQKEPDAQVRLACYDALARYQSAPTVQNKQPEQRVAKEVPDGGWLEKGTSESNITLERVGGDGTVLSVSCLDQITHVRVRLRQPWEGENVVATVDDVPASGNWFVRDNGTLLEFGRGLVAIEELKRWTGFHELVLRGDNGRVIRIPLDGLSGVVKPLRQQCRW